MSKILPCKVPCVLNTYLHVCIYASGYIYVYTHTHTYTTERADSLCDSGWPVVFYVDQAGLTRLTESLYFAF